MGKKGKVISKKEMSLLWAVVPLVVMIISMVIAIVVLEQGPHIPLIIGTSVAALVAWKHGFKWNDIEEMMYKGIKLALPAVIIIMLVGLTIGAWIGGGIVASMVYYGLQNYHSSIFLSNNLYYLYDCFFSNRQFLVNYGNNRSCGDGNWTKYGNTSPNHCRSNYLRIVLWR